MPGNLDRLLATGAVRRRLACCRPYRRPFPSGWAWTHSRYCRGPRTGQKLDAAELQELATERREEALSPEEADRLRPSGRQALLCWLQHPNGCACYGCRYTDASLDDDD